MSEQKSGKGRWIALGCLIPIVAVVVLVGGVILFGYFYVKDSVVMDPKAVETAAQQVMVYKFPQGSQGIMKIGMFGVDVFVIQSRATPPEATLVLALLPEQLPADREDEVRRSIQERMNRGMEVQTSRTEQRTICGTRVPVRIQVGHSRGAEGPRAPAASLEALVRHKGRMRMALVMGTGRDALGAAQAVFGSLSCP